MSSSAAARFARDRVAYREAIRRLRRQFEHEVRPTPPPHAARRPPDALPATTTTTTAPDAARDPGAAAGRQAERRRERETERAEARRRNYEAHCARLREVARGKAVRQEIREAQWARMKGERESKFVDVLERLSAQADSWVTEENLDQRVEEYLVKVFGTGMRPGMFVDGLAVGGSEHRPTNP